MNRRVPFRKRAKGESESWNALIEGVPMHLGISLERVLQEVIKYDPSVGGVLQRRLRLPIGGAPTSTNLVTYARLDPGSLLDMMEVIVQHSWESAAKSPSSHVREHAVRITSDLRNILDESNSAYKFELFEGTWTLTTVVDPVATQALRNIVELNPDAGELLGEAWQFCFQRDPNYDSAYDKAILAVESVATKLLTPNDPAPSLGKAIAHLKDTIGKWTISGLDTERQDSAVTLLGMLQTMWTAQSRHIKQGGIAPNPATRQEAESVLFMAIGIVQLFSRNLIQPLSA